MARKLSLQERENINYLTDVLCRVLPAAQRSFSGALASALVRVKGDQITDADLERVTAKYDELQSALMEVLKAEVLDRVPAVDAKGDGEAFTLRVPAAPEPETSAADVPAGNGAPAGDAGADATSAAGEKGEEPEKKPARKRRTRRKKATEPEGDEAAESPDAAAAAGAEPATSSEDASEVEGAQPRPKSVRPGRGARAARAKAKAAEAAEQEAAVADAPAEAAEVVVPAEDKDEAASAGQEPKKRTRTRSRRGKKQEASVDAATSATSQEAAAADVSVDAAAPAQDPAADAAQPVPDPATSAEAAGEKPAPKRRPRRRRAKKPVEEAVVTGAEAQELLAKEEAAVEAEATGAVTEAVAPARSSSDGADGLSSADDANAPQADASLAEDGTAAAADSEAEGSAEPKAAVADATGEPDAAADKPAKASGRARVRGRGRRGMDKRTRGDNPSNVPYVRRGGESEAALREQIVRLDSRLWMNGWLLSHPGAFKLYERELRGIDEALQKGELPGDLTRRQLAYKMGGNEKFFEYGSDGFRLLRAMGADDLIHHRPMPKADMLYHVPRRRKSMRILVTENLDPWLDVRDLMYEDGRSLILGERIHGVVLGGGNPVVENNRISGLLEALGADTIEVLYWGDIDRAGLSLLQRLQVLLDGQYKVTPFMPAYRLMLERAMERYPDPDQNERTTQENVEVADYSQMIEGLSDDERAYFSSIIEKCGLIPQEILTKADL